MNILFLSTKSPYPSKDGHTLRTFNLLKEAAKENDIYLLTYFLSDEEKENFCEIKKICKEAMGFEVPTNKSKVSLFSGLFMNLFSPCPFVVQKYRSKEMFKAIRRILFDVKIDLVHIDMLPLMNYYEIIKKFPIVLIDHNVESLLLKRQVTNIKGAIKKIFFWLQYIKLLFFEKKQISNATRCIAVSEQDKFCLQKLNSKATISIIPNGTDVEYFFPVFHDYNSNEIVFVGGLNWFPNLDGINYFCENIHPKIREQVDDFKTIVIGKKYNGFKYPGFIEQVGYVSDIRPYVHRSKVFIVPLRVGGGTRLKILDAMAMGKAIVSTSLGCEGIEVENGKHLLIEDEPENFADAVAKLLKDKDKRRFLGENARKLVEEKYNWELIGKSMNRIYKELIQ